MFYSEGGIIEGGIIFRGWDAETLFLPVGWDNAEPLVGLEPQE